MSWYTNFTYTNYTVIITKHPVRSITLVDEVSYKHLSDSSKRIETNAIGSRVRTSLSHCIICRAFETQAKGGGDRGGGGGLLEPSQREAIAKWALFLIPKLTES